jgi:tetratricopeptide (TPR) repeat protein
VLFLLAYEAETMRLVASCGAAIAALLLVLPAKAGSQGDWKDCQASDPDMSIAGCTRVLKTARNNAIAYYNRGNAYQAKGDLDRAISDYNDAIRLDPNYAFAYNSRGKAYRAKGDLDRAISDYNDAIRLDPNYALAYSNRGNFYQDMGDFLSAIGIVQAKGDYDRAIADYSEAIRIDPKSGIASYINRGNAYHTNGDYDRAITDYNEAIRLDPKSATSYRNRGNSYSAKGDFDRAIGDYDEAVRLDPKSADAYAGRGNVYVIKGDYDRAVADFEQAIRFDPKNRFAYIGRGVAFHHKRDYHRAVADFDEAIRLDPQSADAYMGRGNAYLFRGEYDRAIADYNEAIRHNPKYGFAYAVQGNAYQGKSDHDRAIADFEQAIRFDPKSAVSYAYRGNSYSAKGDLDRAIADYNEAIRLDPKLPQAYTFRGVARQEKGDITGASADFDQALRLWPNAEDDDAIANRALVNELKGDYARAREDFIAAMKVSVRGAWAYELAQKHLAALPTSQAQTAQTSDLHSQLAAIPTTENKRRVALVIGNSAYTALRPLSNPANDARLIAKTLRSVGFTLIGGDALLDLNEQKFRLSLKQLGEELHGADVGLFYYAGHGMQIRGTNYLVPVDANPTKEKDAELDMFDAQVAVRQMQAAGTTLNIIILDACRNNPFGGRAVAFARGRGNEEQKLRDVGATSGLAEMKAPYGMLISFATQPRDVAQDGPDDGNSPYSKVLSEIIRKPGLSVLETFNEVARRVDEDTRHDQTPSTFYTYVRPFYFVHPAAEAPSAGGATPGSSH